MGKLCTELSLQSLQAAGKFTHELRVLLAARSGPALEAEGRVRQVPDGGDEGARKGGTVKCNCERSKSRQIKCASVRGSLIHYYMHETEFGSKEQGNML